MKFTKMHGLGNDYIFVNCIEENITGRNELAAKISNRNFGIGSDGLICICPGKNADFSMDMYNSDGSQGKMCGNGIRCFGKYVYDNGLTSKTTVTVESGGELKTLELNVEAGKVNTVRVNMGKPVFTPKLIPVNAEGETFINCPVEVLGKEYSVSCLSLGNPHSVIFVDDVDSLDLPVIGPAFEKHSLFPEQVNTEFIQILDRKTLKMRVWERGSGETLACGTGATASVVIGALTGLCENAVSVKLRGGDLLIEWDREGSGCVFMTGPAVTVYTGDLLNM